MKILKIENCSNCEYFDTFYNAKRDFRRFICKNPKFHYKYSGYKIINRKGAIKGIIPDWCPLEDYKDE